MISIAIVCEARADRDIASTLADRVLIEDAAIHWIDDQSIDHHREWRGLNKNDPFLQWSKIHGIARERSVTGFGHFNGLPGKPDAFVTRKALLLLDKSADRPDAVIRQRDMDDQAERFIGLLQARNEFERIFSIAIGFARAKREAWVLAGFDPLDDEEHSRLDTIRQELWFNPCLKSHELTASLEQAKTSAKRVLRHLSNGEYDRETICWRTAALPTLIDRGAANGLADFINEIASRFVPLFR